LDSLLLIRLGHADPSVPWTDACRFYAPQHFAVARRRPRYILPHQGVETAEVVTRIASVKHLTQHHINV